MAASGKTHFRSQDALVSGRTVLVQNPFSSNNDGGGLLQPQSLPLDVLNAVSTNTMPSRMPCENLQESVIEVVMIASRCLESMGKSEGLRTKVP